MVKTLRISFALRMTTKVNAVLFGFKHLPLLRKWLPDDLYRIQWLKFVAGIFALMWEILTALAGKWLFLLLLVLLPAEFLPMGPSPTLFVHIFLLTTLVGGIFNDYLLETDNTAYYAVLLLGMDARQYSLVQFCFECIKLAAGYILFFLVLGELPFWLWPVLPVFTISVKILKGAFGLWRFDKKGQIDTANPAVRIPAILVLLGTAYGLPALGVRIPLTASVAVMGLAIALAVPGLIRILRFQNYRVVHQQLHAAAEETAEELENASAKQSLKQISDEAGITSSRQGFAYLNDLFFRRHKKLLWKPCLVTTGGFLAAIGLCLVGIFLMPELKPVINQGVMRLLPCCPFIMYIWNRGQNFTQALFMNCDRSLLTYSFYKEPKAILRLFGIRLKAVIAMNLLPAVVLAAGMPLLLWLSGGTAQWTNYVVLVVTVLSLSIFFSLHYLTIYYLLQPYTAGTELKNPAYSVITGMTYVVCYILLDLGLPPIAFGLVAIGFTVVYCLAAFLLVYTLAPRTFRIRC
ncbi:MAG: hypothetical protein IJV82_03780 [Oscillospiraceae bacterium]|nr:hypothetical protein [Oscillospiraceae bacterium]